MVPIAIPIKHGDYRVVGSYIRESVAGDRPDPLPVNPNVADMVAGISSNGEGLIGAGVDYNLPGWAYRPVAAGHGKDIICFGGSCVSSEAGSDGMVGSHVIEGVAGYWPDRRTVH